MLEAGWRRALAVDGAGASLSPLGKTSGRWSEPVSTRRSSLPGSVPLPGSPWAGPGPAEKRQDQIRASSPHGGESAVCFDPNVPALRRNAKAFCRVVLLCRMYCAH